MSISRIGALFAFDEGGVCQRLLWGTYFLKVTLSALKVTLSASS
jgi:hypothetical protein